MSDAAQPLRLNYPGLYLQIHDKRGLIKTLLSLAETALGDALVALRLFDRACATMFSVDQPDEATLEAQENWYESLKAQSLLAGRDQDMAHYDAIAMMREDEWQKGGMPEDARGRLPFLYARMFVSLLNRVRLLLGALSQTAGVPKQARAQFDEFNKRIPALVGVRDSSEHIDERLRGQARKGRKTIKLVGPFLLLENLHGSTLLSTTSDDPRGKVDITHATLSEAVACVQSTIDALPWSGRPRVVLL